MKWMSVTEPSPDFVDKNTPFYLSTPDPEYTGIHTRIRHESPLPFGVYSVTRVNPLYSEEPDGRTLPEPQSPPEDCFRRELRDDTLTVLRQNHDFVKSILVSVRLKGRSSGAELSPIPEGRIDLIPRPIWPRDGIKNDRRSRVNKHNDKSNAHTSHEMSNPDPLQNILRDLSANIDRAMAADRHSAEKILRSLRDQIDRNLRRPDAIATLSRAFSYIHADGSLDLEKGRLELLKRLGKFSEDELSSSSNSTSGFSDQTPSSQSSETPPTSRQNEFDSGRSSDERTRESKSSVSFGSCQYRVIEERTAVASDCIENTMVYAKSETLLWSYPGNRCPDFTLDVHQAEKVMKKIKERKNERFWCRIVVSCLGFGFLLFSVMFFSMMFSNGEKMFGSI